MELVHITTAACPICGGGTVKESVDVDSWRNSDLKIRMHCNGQRWETREFICGYKIEWVPNFMREVPKGRCAKDPTYLAVMEKRKKWRDKVLAMLVDFGEVDVPYRTHVMAKLGSAWEFNPENVALEEKPKPEPEPKPYTLEDYLDDEAEFDDEDDFDDEWD